MINTTTGEVQLTIKGKVYTLAIKTAGLAAIQKRLSPAGTVKQLPAVIAELEAAVKAQSLEHLVIFMWAALQKYHKGLTEDDAMNLIDDAGGIGGLNTAFEDLARSITPDPEDVKELTADASPDPNPPKARAKRR